MLKSVSIALALTLAGAPIAAQTPPPPPPAAAKTQAAAYVKAAGTSDLYEITSSQIALQKSRNEGVRRFAQAMIDHHRHTTQATVAAARQAGLTPMPPQLGGAKASIEELRRATPENFDRLYLGQQATAHQAALDLHQSYASSGDKAPLKASARAAVPIVQQHIQMLSQMPR
ncbi:DUF4142 domain-containing protein [Sphingomonas sp.]|uniref:DUF4142 domain-containing protein n=1 Tax=Sphingomonas sp. TaxID=28214 RepID=UPI00289751F5|nr:DUF4142 domain-containing protein [Sphingomonas sp.]